MGVMGLWPLLEPVGRRVNIETLAGKKVAIGEEGVFCLTPRLERPLEAHRARSLGVPRPCFSLVFYAAPAVAQEEHNGRDQEKREKRDRKREPFARKEGTQLSTSRLDSSRPSTLSLL